MRARSGSWADFRVHLAASWAVLRRDPRLVVITLLLFLLAGLPRWLPRRVGGAVGLAAPVAGLAEAAFCGTQRVWFVRGLRGEALPSDEIVPLTYGFVGRFLALGLAVSIPTGIVVAIAVNVASSGSSATHLAFPGWLRPLLVGYGLVIDVLLTFVVPALALETPLVRQALADGLRTLRDTWPASGWYAAAPGITVTLLALVVPASSVGVPGRMILSAAGAFIGLWFKGAIVAFYLDARPGISSNGASRAARPW